MLVGERKAMQAAEQRIADMRRAHEAHRAGRISGRKLAGALRSAETFPIADRSGRPTIWFYDCADAAKESVRSVAHEIRAAVWPDRYEAAETRAQVAARLGLPETAHTVALLMAGEIDEAEAKRRAATIAHRHEATDYDAMLARGVDRDTARDLIRDER